MRLFPDPNLAPPCIAGTNNPLFTLNSAGGLWRSEFVMKAPGERGQRGNLCKLLLELLQVLLTISPGAGLRCLFLVLVGAKADHGVGGP